MSNKQGNCTSEASVILPIANATTPKHYENACLSPTYNHSLFKVCNYKKCNFGNNRTLVYWGKCIVTNSITCISSVHDAPPMGRESQVAPQRGGWLIVQYFDTPL